MTAAKHLDQVLEETERLARELDELAAGIWLGVPATADDFAHLSRIVTFIRTKAALAQHDVGRMVLDCARMDKRAA